MTGENYLKAAYSYLYIHDFDRALEAFSRAIESDVENPSYYFHGSLTAMRSERWHLALTWAYQAMCLAPNDELFASHIHVVRSRMFTYYANRAMSLHDVDKARSLYRAALELDPLNAEAEDMLVRLEAESEQEPLTSRTSWNQS